MIESCWFARKTSRSRAGQTIVRCPLGLYAFCDDMKLTSHGLEATSSGARA